MAKNNLSDNRRYLIEVFQISTLVYLSTYLTFRIIETTYHSLTMWMFSIPHWHRITYIQHKTRSLDYWDDYRVMVVYGMGAVFLFSIGVIQYQRVIRMKYLDWVERLIMLWLSVHFVNAIVGGMISGSIINSRFGAALRWLFPNSLLVTIAFIILGFTGLVILAKISASHFLSININKDHWVGRVYQQEFLITIVLLPWATATLLLSGWDYVQHDYYSVLQNIVLSVFSIVATFFSSNLAFVGSDNGFRKSAGNSNRNRSKKLFLLFIIVVFGISMAAKYL